MVTLSMCERLPLELVVAGAVEESELIQRQLPTSDGVARPEMLRVLIVADEEGTTDGLVYLARRWGHAARVAYDGVAALRVAAEQHTQVVLVDLDMPQADGCQMAQQLRVAFPHQEFFVIAITGRADEPQRQRCSAAGIDLVLLKPVDPSVVETLLMFESSYVNLSRTSNEGALLTKDLFHVSGQRTSARFALKASRPVKLV